MNVIRSPLYTKDIFKRAKRAVSYQNKVRQGNSCDDLARYFQQNVGSIKVSIIWTVVWLVLSYPYLLE